LHRPGPTVAATYFVANQIAEISGTIPLPQMGLAKSLKANQGKSIGK